MSGLLAGDRRLDLEPDRAAHHVADEVAVGRVVEALFPRQLGRLAEVVQEEAHQDDVAVEIRVERQAQVGDVEQLERVLGGSTHQIEVVSLLATCLMDLGRAGEAESQLSDALKTAKGDVAVALRYDLGCALAAGNKRAKALAAFKKVAAADKSFRDVAERIAELKK